MVAAMLETSHAIPSVHVFCAFLQGPTDSPPTGPLQEVVGPNRPPSRSPRCLNVKPFMHTTPKTQMSSVSMQMTSLTSLRKVRAYKILILRSIIVLVMWQNFFITKKKSKYLSKMLFLMFCESCL